MVSVIDMRWIVGDWWSLLEAPWAAIALSLVAVLCGGLVGIERERREKPAGLRTLVLVCLGSAVFTMISFAFTTTTGDSGRVAAQIVTGIGFLGAGVILRETVGVTGTTTAATIWITAAMGMVVGAGRAPAGLALAILIRATTVTLHVLEERRIAALPPTVVSLRFHPDHGKTRIRMERMLVEFEARYEILDLDERRADVAHMRVRFRLPQRHERDLLAGLAALPEVHEVHEERG